MDTNRFRKKTDYEITPRWSPTPQQNTQRQLNQQPNPAPRSPTTQPTSDIASPQEHVPPVQPTKKPVAYTEKPAQTSATPAAVNTPATAPTATISVQINMPKFHRPTLPKLPYRRIGIWAGIGVLIVVVLMGGVLLAKHFIHSKPAVSFNQGSQALAALTKPSFTPIAPKDQPGLAASEAGNTAFDGTRDTYSYSDQIDGTTFVLSQQPIPSKFNSASQAVSYVAKSIGATIFTTSGTTAYLSTNPKTKSQTIVFTLNDLLIFIQSEYLHTNSEWQSYIDNLQ